MGSAVTIPIGQTILVSSLTSEVSKRSVGIPAQNVVHAGATNLNRLSADPSTLRALQASYSQAVTNILYFSLGVLVFALPFAVLMEWKSVKSLSGEHAAIIEHEGVHSD